MPSLSELAKKAGVPLAPVAPAPVAGPALPIMASSTPAAPALPTQPKPAMSLSQMAQKAGVPLNTATEPVKEPSKLKKLVMSAPPVMAAGIIKDAAVGTYDAFKNLPGKIREDFSEAKKSFDAGVQESNQPGAVPSAGAKNYIKAAAKATLRPAADVLEAIFSPVAGAIGSAMERTGTDVALQKTAEYLVDKSGVTENKKFQEFATEHPNAEADFSRGLNLLMTRGAKGKIKPGEIVEQAKVKIPAAVEKTKAVVKQTVDNYKAKEAIKDVETLKKISGQITQGKTADVPVSVRELSNVDPKQFKTYEAGEAYLTKKIENVVKKLDESLETDKRVFKMNELETKIKIDGKDVSNNFIRDGLDQLDEFYQKTNDLQGQAEISNLRAIANSTGLTVKQVNDLARLHGRELNAYNANGQLASGLSKQAAENTRSAMKEVAREKFGNEGYKLADKAISDTIRVRDLFSDMKEKVNTLKQKIQDRSMGAKVGYLIGKVINTIGLGSPKGIVEALIPRGQGFKVLNALDLERLLQKSIEKIQKLNEGNVSEEVLIQRLQSIIDESEAVKPSAPPKLPPKTPPTAPPASPTAPVTPTVPSKPKTTKQKLPKPAKPVTDAEGNTIPEKPPELKIAGVSKAKPLADEAKKYKSAEEFVKKQTPVYHGTSAELKRFNNKQGTFFTDDMMNADGYASGGNVYEGYLDLKNPLVIDAKGRMWSDLDTPYGKSTQDVVGKVDSKKYDGVIFENIKDSWIDDADVQDPSTIYYAFKPRDAFKNESQLTEIWDKANKKSAIPLKASKSKSGINFERAKDLSPENVDIETKAFNKIAKDEDKIVAQYMKENGKIVNTDDFRPYFIEEGYAGHNAAAVQEPSSYLSKRVREKLLKNPEEFVTVYAGGSGTGKTSAVRSIEEMKPIIDDSAAIIDGNLSSLSSAEKIIKQAEDAGKVPTFIYTYRDPIESFVEGVVKRMKNNKKEMGRLVPTKIVAENHIGSWDVIKNLEKKGYFINFVDNSLGKDGVKLSSLDELSKKIKYPSLKELTNTLNKETKKLYEQGKITKEEYEGYIN